MGKQGASAVRWGADQDYGARMTFQRIIAAGLIGSAIGLSACDDSGSLSHRSMAPIPPETLALMESKGTTKEAPVLIRAYKKESEIEVWKLRSDGKYAHLKTFPICRWSGQLGPKTHEGDRQAPEGFYSIGPAQMNPNSSYYLSFNVGYPNAYDRAHGSTGGAVMVHGACSSAGCYSMTDKQIAEIYAIARTALNSGQHAIQMQAYPFRMTAENLAKHRLDPNIGFWKQLKEGSDHFEVTKREPLVTVCGKRYVFNAVPASGHADPSAPCPAMQVDQDARAQVAEKAAKDDARVAQLSSEIKPVRLVYQDGSQHPDFFAKVSDVSRPETLLAPAEIPIDDKPARLPAKALAKQTAKTPLMSATTTVAPTAAAPEAVDPAKVSALASTQTPVGTIGDWLSLHKPAAPAEAK
jgi:murein L,D-transpeptidase YafK